ncbi:unnamed protein product [marine sediment metagenome]|uniref:Uncharacterized protein n=1 Tax=marine sediment metagenome TaxID=412755 RepID=X0YVQ4_9ZZZZ
MRSQYPILDTDSVFFILALFESEGIITEIQRENIMSRLNKYATSGDSLAEIAHNILYQEK